MGTIISKLKTLFSSKKMEICIVGLDNSGKTTLSQKLSLSKTPNTGPTIGLDIKTFKKGNITLNMWDLGGQGNIKSAIQIRVVKIRNWDRCDYFRG